MPRSATLVPHLPVAEVQRRYRQTADPVARTHWQIIWLVASGHPIPEVAPLVGYTANWVREIVRRYNAGGPAGLGDRRQHNRGHPPLLPPALQAELATALAGPAPDGGLWTCAKVAAWMADRLGRPVGTPRGWEALRALGFTPQRPRPRATTADPAAQAAFKKGGSNPPSMR
jgi:transposase